MRSRPARGAGRGRSQTAIAEHPAQVAREAGPVLLVEVHDGLRVALGARSGGRARSRSRRSSREVEDLAVEDRPDLPSSLRSGWWLPARSMMLRRRMPSATPGSMRWPSSSGPRCSMTSVMRPQRGPSMGGPPGSRRRDSADAAHQRAPRRSGRPRASAARGGVRREHPLAQLALDEARGTRGSSTRGVRRRRRAGSRRGTRRPRAPRGRLARDLERAQRDPGQARSGRSTRTRRGGRGRAACPRRCARWRWWMADERRRKRAGAEAVHARVGLVDRVPAEALLDAADRVEAGARCSSFSAPCTWCGGIGIGCQLAVLVSTRSPHAMPSSGSAAKRSSSRSSTRAGARRRRRA